MKLFYDKKCYAMIIEKMCLCGCLVLGIYAMSRDVQSAMLTVYDPISGRTGEITCRQNTMGAEIEGGLDIFCAWLASTDKTTSIPNVIWDMYTYRIHEIEESRFFKWGEFVGEVRFENKESLLRSFLTWALTVDSWELTTNDIDEHKEEEKLRVRHTVVDHGSPRKVNVFEKFIKSIKDKTITKLRSLVDKELDSTEKFQLALEINDFLSLLVCGKVNGSVDNYRLLEMLGAMISYISKTESSAFLNWISPRRTMHPEDNVLLKMEKASAWLTPHPEIPAAMRKNIELKINNPKTTIGDSYQHNINKKSEKTKKNEEREKRWFKSINEARTANGHEELSWDEFITKTQELEREIEKERALRGNPGAAIAHDVWSNLLRPNRFVPPKKKQQQAVDKK
jgi:hypothetical protein